MAPHRAPTLGATLVARIRADPMNLVATGIFVLAVLHAFAAGQVGHWLGRQGGTRRPWPQQVAHLLGEVEAVFVVWALVLVAAVAGLRGAHAAGTYLTAGLDFSQPAFVLVVMAVASSRPILALAESGLSRVAAMGGGGIGAWWLSILLLGPLLGAVITGPAAMTISALLLGRQVYLCRLSNRLAYGTLALLFVNVSVGAALTPFTPPVIMAAGPWNWGLAYVFGHLGWKALAGILTGTLLYYYRFRGEFRVLNAGPGREPPAAPDHPVPVWTTLTQVAFLAFTLAEVSHPARFLGGFAVFLGFAAATRRQQGRLHLRPAVMVALFLAGLIVLCGAQAWWLQPALAGLGHRALFASSALLTGFNDNAAITYLATLVPGLSEPLKLAVVAGATAGGGLTVIANAPNPAGQSILRRFFTGGVSPFRLFVAALPATLVVSAAFLLL
jgi:hypothetical protein